MPGGERNGHDLRVPALAVAAWAGGIAASAGAGRTVLATGMALVAVALVLALARHRRGAATGRELLLAASALVGVAVVAGALLRQAVVAQGPLPSLAEERAVADLTGTVVSDPRPVAGRWGEQVVLRLRVERVTARGATSTLGARVVVLGGPAWRAVALGEQVTVTGRLVPADDPHTAALVTGARDPVRIRGPDVWWRASGTVRASVRDAVAHRPADQAALVPALVDGDDAGLSPDLEQDFRTTGLTHLTAVSGTNLTLVVGFLLLMARWVGVRRRWLHLVGLLGIVGFVLLARTEPSVLRAAAMGVVGLFAFAADGRRRGLRALAVAVVVLLLVQPALATTAGFALSVLATAGIVVLGPTLQAALARWLPAPVAEAVSVPLAAQLACTPVVAALSGEVSLVAVLANLLVAPLVGPATVLGLGGGVVGLVCPWLGRLLGTGAGWCVAWLVVVARHGADLPGASIGWGTGALALAALTGICVLLAGALPRLLARRDLGIAVASVLVVVVVGLPGLAERLPLPLGRWPPRDWVLVACDVGQGDAVVLSLGDGSGVLVDAGPEPDRVDRCLDRLGIRSLPLVVLTHFHADHVDGLAGALRGRRTGVVETSAMLDPPDGVDAVRRVAAEAGVPVRVAAYGLTRRYADLTLQVLWPDLPEPVAGPGDGSAANDASVVLLVESRGLRLLLTGDVEPPGQARLARAVPGLDVDVLKVPHHGSRYQDLDWLHGLGPEAALVSVGAGNDYGHPDPVVLEVLERSGAVVGRTDTGGDLAVVAGGEGAVLVTRR